MQNRREFLTGVGAAVAANSLIAAATNPGSAFVKVGERVELHSKWFGFHLDLSRGLRAVAWENKITGRKLNMGGGQEVEFDVGMPGGQPSAPLLRVVNASGSQSSDGNQATFELRSGAPSSLVRVRYAWNDEAHVLSKAITIQNTGSEPWKRLLNLRLGDYSVDSKTETSDPDYPIRVTASPWNSTEWAEVADPAGRERGFPAYVEWQFFLGLAHPSGFALRKGNGVTLSQRPGRVLDPGEVFESMEAVYGVSRAGQSRPSFREYLQSRMRRVRRSHDRPYAILSSLGGNPTGEFWETSDYVEDNLELVTRGQRECGLHWDYYSIDFWHDPYGDLTKADPRRFPQDFKPILPKLEALGTKPGLWIDSGGYVGSKGFDDWTCGGNPALADATTSGNGKGALCRATEPANRMYIDGFRHQCAANGVRMAAFDNCGFPATFLDPTCNNPKHQHLPGEYSTEAIQNAIIEFLRTLDAECPDVFIKLFWGYRSPWWLLHADTSFDTGIRIEAASFAEFPTLVARDSVTRVMDRARWMAKDLPWLGADSLGVWLADWGWNMHQREEDWHKGVVMDLCRGQMLPQLWTDAPYLHPQSRRQMAEFIALVKAQPACFRNARFILGNPWKDEAYGYCCTDGRRAFVAINNAGWTERSFSLEPGEEWGLPARGPWEFYRWYPNPAHLLIDGSEPRVPLGPFEVALFELAAAGSGPSLNRTWNQENLPVRSSTRAEELPITVVSLAGSRQFLVRGSIPPLARAATVALTAEFSSQGRPYLTLWKPDLFVASAISGFEGEPCTPAIDPRGGVYPSCWQTWRITCQPNPESRDFRIDIRSELNKSVAIRWTAHILTNVNGDLSL